MEEKGFDFSIKNGQSVITGCRMEGELVAVPEELGGCRVSGIEPRSFHRRKIGKLLVPAGITIPGEWFEPEEGIIPMYLGVPFKRLMSPEWRLLGARGYLELLKRGEHPETAVEEGYREFVRTHFGEFEEEAVSTPAMMRLFMEEGLIPLCAIEGLISKTAENSEMRAEILNYRKHRFTPEELSNYLDLESERLLRGPSVKELRAKWSVIRRSDGTYSLTAWHSDEKIVIVPARIGRITVTGIGTDCFSPMAPNLDEAGRKSRQSIVRIVLPDTITDIGSGACRGCTSLEEVRIPEEIRTIGDSAFVGCAALRKADVPDGIGSIGKSAFLGCYSLADREGYVVRAGHLYDYKGGPDAVIPQHVIRISARAFEDHVALASVKLHGGITAIDEYAFCGCTSLRELVVPGSVRTIGRAAAAFCTRLQRLRVEDGTERIGENAFRYCSMLHEVRLPVSLTDIGFNILMDCADPVVTAGRGSKIEEYARLYQLKFQVEEGSDEY